MQGFKKSLVALLAVAMVLSLVGTAFAAPADVAGTKYEDAAVRLIALGVFKGDDKGNFNPENPITRAEAAAIIVRALGLEKSAELMKGVTKFADVNADPGLQWATGAINIAVSNGIVSGYPNGQFGGRDNVTYAQLAKMILYALNYGVVVEGGVWPTAVLAKADDLGILDGMSVVADAPILRGDAAKMLDNSLDVNGLRQFGYGDIQQYAEDGKTLLERMGLDEVEGRVVEIPEVQDALDADEVVVRVTKENGEKVTAKDETYAELEGVDVQSLFGLEVKAWVKDDKVVFVEKKTADKDVFIDTLAEVKDDDKVLLTVLDDTVYFLNATEEATIYVNNVEADVDDITVAKNGDWAGLYGRFVRKDNKIVFAYLFDFDNNGVVTSVDGEKVKYFTTTDKVRTLDLSDADAVYVYNADLSKSSLDEIEEDNVVYWWEADDEYYVVAAADEVEGELERVKSTKVTIDGKGYTIKKADGATYSLDNDKAVSIWNDTASAIDDLDGEEVVALLDLNGHVRHLRGNVKATSGTQYGIVVGAPSDGKAIVFTKDGEEVTYDIDKKADWAQLEPKTATKYYHADEDLSYYLLSYKVDADGEIADGLRNNIKQVYYVDTAGVVEAYDETGTEYSVLEKATKSTRKVVLDGTDEYYIDSSTAIFRAVNSKGELDPEIVSWDNFKDLILDNDVANQAHVFGTVGKTAKAIVFVNKAFEGTTEDEYYGVVTDKWRSGGDDWVEVDVFDGEKAEYVLGSGDPAVGSLVVFKLNGKDELEVVTVPAPVFYEGVVSEVDGYYVTIIDGSANEDTVRIDADAVGYKLKDTGKIDKKVYAADIDDQEVVRVLVDEDGIGKAFVKKVDYVRVTGVTLDKDTLALEVGGADGTLVATVAPAGADVKAVVWTSSDKDVATVVDGTVTAVAAGTATITVTTVDGGFKANCVVTVTAPGETAEQKLQAKLDQANAGEEVVLTEDVEMDIELDKAISLDLASFTIGGNVSITDLAFSGTLNIKAGTITGNLTVNTPNATVNNEATVGGTITITDVKSGTWNELVSGNTLVFNAAGKTLNIGTGVSVNSLTVDANSAYVVIEGQVTAFTANSAVTVNGADKIVSAVIEAAGVVLDQKPEAIITTNDVKIGDDTKTHEELNSETFLTSLEYAFVSQDDTLYTISYNKVENKVGVMFKKAGLQASQDTIGDVETAAKSFIAAMFSNEELNVKKVELFTLSVENKDTDQVWQLAVNLLNSLGGDNILVNYQLFLKGIPVNQTSDITVTLENGSSFTVKGVTANFTIDVPYTDDDLK